MTLPDSLAMFDFILKEAKNMHQALISAKKPTMFDIFSYPDDYVLLASGPIKVNYRQV